MARVTGVLLMIVGVLLMIVGGMLMIVGGMLMSNSLAAIGDLAASWAG